MADSELRADQIASGVSFLKHPKVKENPLSQRLAFLEEKGLTPGEIQAAVRAASEDGSGDEVTASLNSGTGGVDNRFGNASGVGAPSPLQGWSEPEPPSPSTVPRLAAASLCAAGAVSGFLLRGLAADDLDGPSTVDSTCDQTADHTAVAALWNALSARLPHAGPPENYAAPEASHDGISEESGAEPVVAVPGVYVGRAEAAEALVLDQAVKPLALLALGHDCFGGAEAGLERLVLALTAPPDPEHATQGGDQQQKLGSHLDASSSLVVGAEELAKLINDARLVPPPPKPLDQNSIANLLAEMTPPTDNSLEVSLALDAAGAQATNHKATAAAVVVAAAARWDLPLEHRLQLVAGAIEAHAATAAAAQESRCASAEATAAVATQRAAAAESTADALATRVGTMANELASLQAQVAALALRGGGSNNNSNDDSDGTGLNAEAAEPLPTAPPVPTPQEAVAEFATKAMEAALAQSASTSDGTGDTSSTSAPDAATTTSEDHPPRKEAKAAATASVVAGIDTLLMYTSNLLKKPKDPRVRRISTANQVYTKTLKKLAGAQALLEYVGFTAKGATLEYTKPTEAPTPTASTVASDAVSATTTASTASSEATAAAKDHATADGGSQGSEAAVDSNNSPAKECRLAATVAALEALRKKLLQTPADDNADALTTPADAAPEVSASPSATAAAPPADEARETASAPVALPAEASEVVVSNNASKVSAEAPASATQCESSSSSASSNVVDCRPDPANLVTQAKLDAFFKPRSNTTSDAGGATKASESTTDDALDEASTTVGESAKVVDDASVTANAVGGEETSSLLETSSSETTSPSSLPQLPMSEVVAMVERGERPPGIRDDLSRDAISSYQPNQANGNASGTSSVASPSGEGGDAPASGDVLPASSVSVAAAGSPPKPWEAGQANGAAELVNADSTDVSSSTTRLTGGAPGDLVEVQGSQSTSTTEPGTQRSDQKKGTKKGNKKGNKGKSK